MARTIYKYPSKHRDWVCPSATCKFELRTQATQYAPSHRCNPNAPSTEKILVPNLTP